ncbi:MAG: Exodeoxyribonuclease 7 large subunit [Phycisphaerales bacterium]|nr:Exodeoxyribonuclease 7 large subunit [Phycisphaerales bacterium]
MAARRAADQRPKTAPAPTVLTVSQLSARLDAVVREGIPGTIQVVGEVSGFRDRTHWYFDLKDDASVIGCVMFQSAARKSPVAPENGVQVVIKGRLEYYGRQGRVTLLVESLEPVGAGAMDLALRKLVEEVRALGWLDPSRKRAVPRFPSRVAVITSRTGAALQDVLVTMRRRCPSVSVLVVDVRVQGEKAECDIADAIREVSARAGELGIDAVLVTRGGGSKEDLWCFNDRAVAEAIVRCSVPVVAAIGHETDTTLAELVADERCATPTQAAMRLTPDVAELLRQIDSAAARLESVARRAVTSESRHVENLAARPMFRQPVSVVRRCGELVDEAADSLAAALKRAVADRRGELRLAAATLNRFTPRAIHAAGRHRAELLGQRLTAAVEARIDHDELEALADDLARAARLGAGDAARRLESAHARLETVSPQRVLERGYSVTLTADGRALRRAADAPAGTTLTTRVAEGSVESVVTTGSQAPSSPASKPQSGMKPPTPPSPRGRGSASQEGLFGP